MNVLSYAPVPGYGVASRRPAPPLSFDTLWTTRLSWTPASSGWGCPSAPTARGSWLGRGIPQSNALPALVLNAIRAWAPGPTDVGPPAAAGGPPPATRIPPPFSAPRLGITLRAPVPR